MRKKKILLFQIVVAILLICTSVYATLNVTLSLKVSSNSVKPGDEFIVTLELKDVSSKVTSVSGYINYNKDIFEKLTVDSIVKDSDNTVTIGNEKLNVEDLTNRSADNLPNTSEYVGFNGSPTSGNDSKIVIDFKNGITTDVDLLKIKFKVKSSATEGEVKEAIKYDLFTVTAGNDNTDNISKSIDITIQKTDSIIGNTDYNSNKTNLNTVNNIVKNYNVINNTAVNKTKNTVNNIVQNTNKIQNNTVKNSNITNNNTNSSKNNQNKTSNTDNTVASKILPATGATIIIIPVIILVIIAYICYYKYVKYKNL